MSEFNVEEFEVVELGDAGEETRQGGPGDYPDSVYFPKGKIRS